MLASRGGGTVTSTTNTATVSTLTPPGSQSYVVVAVGISTITNTVSSVSSTSGTFVKAASIVSATKTLEIWIGYNFGLIYPTSLTVIRTAGTANMTVTAFTLDSDAATAVAPTFITSTGSTATSTSVDSGSLTPAVGDILIAAMVLSSITADSTARAHTGNAYLSNTGAELTNIRTEVGYADAVLAVPSKETWTIPSAEWAAIQVMWTPDAPPTPAAALLVKGLTTATADAGSAF